MTDQVATNKAIPELSIDVRLLAERLKKATPGEVISYADLSSVIGQDVRGRQGYARLKSARRVVQREANMIFEAVTRQGLKRCDDMGIVKVAQSCIDSIHRRATRGLKAIACVNVDTLDNNGRILLNATASHLGVLRQVTTAKSQEKLTQAVAKTSDKLPLQKTLEAFAS